MKLKLIKTENYLVAVDYSDIKVGDWVYNNVSKEMYRFNENFVNYEKKVIAHLPINDSADLKGVSLLPPIENEAETLAFRHTNPLTDYLSAKEFNCMKEGFESGYNKAREKYKFTEEDMKRIALESWGTASQPMERKIENLESIIESNIKLLSQQKTPTHFEFEMEAISKIVGNTWQDYKSIKIITNAQGQQVACGKYIYE